MSKACTSVLHSGKFTRGKLDVSQKFVMGCLVTRSELIMCSPLDFDGKMLNLQNKIDNHWSEFHLV